MKWNAINNYNEPGMQKSSQIAQILFNHPHLTENTGLMWGKTGIALFLFYYARISGDQKYHLLASQLMEDVFEEIGRSEVLLHTISEGLAGIGWMTEHIVKNNFDSFSTDEVLEDLDYFLSQALELEIQEENYSYLHGYLGIGWYFISRLPNPEAIKKLEQIVKALKNHAVVEEDHRMKWFSVREDGSESLDVDLSLAQGMAGIIVFLSRLVHLGIDRENVEPLLSGAISFLLHHRLDVNVHKSHFPRWVKTPVSTKMEWAYGDPGIGMALWQAAYITNDLKLQQVTLDILRHTAARKDYREETIYNSGLLDGSAGLAQVFSRMYQMTDETVFKEAAQFWFEHTLGMACKEDGLAGYKTWRCLGEKNQWVNDAGVIEGIAGIGLTLISVMSDIEPSWDDCMMMGMSYKMK